jgi:hypothetical protein
MGGLHILENKREGELLWIKLQVKIYPNPFMTGYILNLR